MDKLFTIKYDSMIIDCVSTEISRFINSIEDKLDGVFTVCYDRGKNRLRNISLCIVTNDLELIRLVQGKKLESDICNINVVGIPSMCFFGIESNFPIDRMLKSGTILYDKAGTLAGIKKNLDKDKDVITLRKKGAIKTKPPIQYVKK